MSLLLLSQLPALEEELVVVPAKSALIVFLQRMAEGCMSNTACLDVYMLNSMRLSIKLGSSRLVKMSLDTRGRTKLRSPH